jgi:hypothetical protein
MMRRSVCALLLLLVGAACHRRAADGPQAMAQGPSTANPNAPVYLCPMDRDIRALAPGKCPRCGMKLVTSVPDPVEYHVDLDTDPVPEPGQNTHLVFHITDPWKGNPVTKFSLVHEKLYHAFVVSSDLQFFMHGHPQLKNGAFEYDVTFPRPGMYRILSDFYPEASAPQLIANTVFVPGSPIMPRVILTRDYEPKQGENMGVSLTSNPETPFSGVPARLRFTLNPADGFEKYLGVWGHMLAASDDLIDLMHTHPTIANGSNEVEFNVVFPRPTTYRVWVQFQRKGMVNTVHFDVPVHRLPQTPDEAVAALRGGRAE